MDAHILTEEDLDPASPVAPDDAEAATEGNPLDGLNPWGEVLRANWPLRGERRWLYTPHPNQNNAGIHNHFQGMQRLTKPGWLAVSGGNWRELSGEVFLLRMNSRPARGAWLSNVARQKRPPGEDRLEVVVQLRRPPLRPNGGAPRNRTLWHAGGMDVLGDILAVALEHTPNPLLGAETGVVVPDDPDNSAIRFLDVSDPAKPKLFRHGITREGSKAGAVALTRLPNGHYLCAVWTDSDREPRPVHLDFYLSRTRRFDGQFRQRGRAVKTWVPGPSEAGRFQALNLVRGPAGLYLVGFCVTEGDHQAEVYSVEIPDSDRQPRTTDKGIAPPRITRLAPPVRLRCRQKFCDMSAASGVFVEESGLVLAYSGELWRRNDEVVLTEFRRLLARPARLTDRTAWIELYPKADFEGACVTILDVSGDRASIRDYKKIYARERNFGDKTWSVRYCLPAGLSYQLFKHDRFRRPLHKLLGTGQVESVSLAALGIEEEVSSSRVVPS